MKKLLSLTIATLLCLSMLSAVIIPTAAEAAYPSNPTNALIKSYDVAANGDLLYVAQFGLDFGAYQSKEFDKDPKNLGTLKISNDAYGVAVELPNDGEGATAENPKSASTGKFWYGGLVKGLPFGEGKQYTIKYKIKNDNSGKGTGNNGFFFTGDFENPDATTAGTIRKLSHGSYGNLTTASPFYSLFRDGNKITAEIRSSANAYVKFSDDITLKTPVADADGYVDCQVEIDGYNYYLYVSGGLFDWVECNDAVKAAVHELAVIFYTYSSGGGLKNVEIYKGLTLTNPADFVTTEVTTNPGDTTPDPYAEDDDDVPVPAFTTGQTTTATATDPVNTPEVTTADEAPSDSTAAPDNKNCGGFNALISFTALLACAAAFVVVRKKH